MKKIIISALLSTCTFLSYSQIENGKWIAGAGFQINRFQGKGEELTTGGVTQTGKGIGFSLSFNGEIGRQLTQKSALGLGFSYANPSSKSYNPDGSLIDRFNYPSLKTYLFYQLQKKLHHKVSYNPRAEAYYKNRNTNSLRYTSGFDPIRGKVRSNNYGVELKPLTFRYFLNQRFFLEASLASLAFEYGNTTDYRSDKTIKSSGTSLLLNGGSLLDAITINVVF